MTATKPPAPLGANCTLSVAGYGSLQVVCEGLSFGIDITTTETNEANKRTLYTQRVTTDTFAIGIALKGMDAYNAFGTWIADYLHHLSSAKVNTLMMRVSIPLRNFDQYGIPQQVQFGGTFNDFLYHITVPFQGTIDPTAVVKGDVSTFALDPQSETFAESQYFYPGLKPNLMTNNADPLYSDTQSELSTAINETTVNIFPAAS